MVKVTFGSISSEESLLLQKDCLSQSTDRFPPLTPFQSVREQSNHEEG